MPVRSRIRNGKKTYYYVINYTDLNGKYRQVTGNGFPTAAAARAALREKEKSFNAHATGDYTFNEAISEYLAMKKETVKPQTYPKCEVLCKHISELIGTIKIQKLKLNQYEMFKEQLKAKGFCTAYLNRIHATVISVVKYCRKRHGVYTDIPEICEGFTNRDYTVKKMDYYTLDEFKRFISVVDEIKWYAFFTTLFYCGLRCGEANALTWNDIDFDNRIISITKTVNTKMVVGDAYLVSSPKTKGSVRELPMPMPVMTSLTALRSEYERAESFSNDWCVFGGYRSLPESSIQKAKRTYCQKAGLKEIRIHDFRHSCASLLINHGANITVVARYLGHSDVSMTLNTYSHFYKSKLTEIVDLIDML